MNLSGSTWRTAAGGRCGTADHRGPTSIPDPEEFLPTINPINQLIGETGRHNLAAIGEFSPAPNMPQVPPGAVQEAGHICAMA